MRNVICPVDFSKQSQAALRFASELAHRVRGKVLIVYVAPPPPADSGADAPGTAGVSSVARADVQRRATSRIGQHLQNLTPSADVEFEQVLRVGDPAEEIVRLARESGASQIVMGTHGRPGFHRVLMGSTAESVVRDAPCPVTVIRNEDVDNGPDGA